MQALLQVQSPNGSPISILPLGYGGNYYQAPAGGAIAIPAGARFAYIVTFAGAAWVRGGKDVGVTAAVPSGAIMDGTAPAYIPAGAADTFVVSGLTHIALLSTGDVRLEFFS